MIQIDITQKNEASQRQIEYCVILNEHLLFFKEITAEVTHNISDTY